MSRIEELIDLQQAIEPEILEQMAENACLELLGTVYEFSRTYKPCDDDCLGRARYGIFLYSTFIGKSICTDAPYRVENIVYYTNDFYGCQSVVYRRMYYSLEKQTFWKTAGKCH